MRGARAAAQTRETRATAHENMESIPDEIMLSIFGLLSIREGKKKESLSAAFSGFQQIQTDRRGKCQRNKSFHNIREAFYLASCSLVCSKWYCYTEDNILWRRIFSLKLGKFPVNVDVIVTFAERTSWKLAFQCCSVLKKREHAPFWNDVEFFLNIQQVYCSPRTLKVEDRTMCSPVQRLSVTQQERQPDLRQFVYAPCNGLFWLLLNLKLNATSISTSFSRGKIQEEKTMRDLQKNILVLNQHFGSATFLQKLRDIAAVPPRKYFLSRYHNHVTSSLLIQLSCGCVHTPLKPPATTWPSPMSAYTDWNKDFVEPVQDAVVQVLKTWVELTGNIERGTKVGWSHLFQWLDRFAQEDFWLGGRGKCVTQVLQQMHARALCLNYPLSHPINDSVFSDITNTSISAETVANKLYTWTFHHLGKIPKLDLINYLTGCNNDRSCSVVNNFIQRYCDGLAGKVTGFCTIQGTSKKSKVSLLHHVINVCACLKVVRDFTSMKALLSATRAAVGQTHLTHLSWNDVKIEHCKKFKVLEDFIDHRTGYANYLSHVKELKEPFVPYLPAHRQHIQQQMASASFKTRDSVPPLSAPIVSLMGLSQQSEHVCVVHPLVEECRSNKLRALHKQKNSYLYSFELHEVPAAEHVLQYLCY